MQSYIGHSTTTSLILPAINDPIVYGAPNHGISDISVQFGMNGYQTSYALKTFFSEFGREAPLDKINRIVSGNIIHPFDFDFERFGPTGPIDSRKELSFTVPNWVVDFGSIIKKATGIGLVYEPVKAPEEVAVVFVPADDPVVWLLPFDDFSDTIDENSFVIKRRIFHFKSDNIDEWKMMNNPEFIVNTIGNGFAFVQNKNGNNFHGRIGDGVAPVKWNVRYAYKDFSEEIPRDNDHTFLACAVSMNSLNAARDAWQNRNEPLINADEGLYPTPGWTWNTPTRSIRHTVCGISLVNRVVGIVMKNKDVDPGGITFFGFRQHVQREDAAGGAFQPEMGEAALCILHFNDTTDTAPTLVKEIRVGSNINDKMYLMVERIFHSVTAYYYSFDGVVWNKWTTLEESNTAFQNGNQIGFGYAQATGLPTIGSLGVSFDWVAYKEALRDTVSLADEAAPGGTFDNLGVQQFTTCV